MPDIPRVSGHLEMVVPTAYGASRLHAMRTGLVALTITVSLIANSCQRDSGPVEQDKRPGAIAGRVYIAGEPRGLAYAIIRLESPARIDTAGIDGNYAFPGLPQGIYKVVASARGFDPDSVMVGVIQPLASIANFSLVSQLPIEGLILFLPFSGEVVDASGYANHVSAHGGLFTADRSGRISSAYVLNGTDEYVNLGSNPILNPLGSITITAWIFKTKPGRGAVVSRWEVGNGENGRSTYSLGVDDSLTWTISANGAPTGRATSTIRAGPILLDTWYFVAGTWDGSTMRLFLNGVQVDSAAQTSMAFSPDVRTGIGATIGRQGDPAVDFLGGVVDDLRIFSRALRKEEIQVLFSALPSF